MDSSYQPKTGETTGLWLAKIVSGLLIIIILCIHFVVNHLVAEEGLLSFQDVVRYYQNPIVVVMEVAFLLFVVSHSLLGVRSILLDLKPSRTVLTVANWFLMFVGVGAIAYGIWLALTVASYGTNL
ncbi:MAG: hypothetical protein GYA17_05755 [Chloroflexi bacterium]|jgi:succinate dehydrogenase / fumarate reductase membrane anchor subunit|nr:hypothetical protein [Anaerolineaceae bacterium]NMB87842.1 hypothetical protein [Chloroflexota bacterium]